MKEDKKDNAIKINVKDERTYLGEDNNGHLSGSNKANSNEQDTEGLREMEDDNEFNKLDDRGDMGGGGVAGL